MRYVIVLHTQTLNTFKVHRCQSVNALNHVISQIKLSEFGKTNITDFCENI
jgi:hypothetical protein